MTPCHTHTIDFLFLPVTPTHPPFPPPYSTLGPVGTHAGNKCGGREQARQTPVSSLINAGRGSVGSSLFFFSVQSNIPNRHDCQRSERKASWSSHI